MKANRFAIECTVHRGDQDAYGYTVHAAVKLAKVQRLLDRAALDIINHEGGNRADTDYAIQWGPLGGPVRFQIGIATFEVSARALT